MVRFDYGVILVESLKNATIFTDAKAIALTHHLSPSLMEKVAQDLRRAGWLESRRGAGGGYKLVKSEISVSDVINFFERPYTMCPINRIVKNKS